MAKVLLYSLLLVGGLLLGQVPAMTHLAEVVRLLTTFCLAFIMVHVGYEFEVDRSALRAYGWDYLVAATAAAFPWIFAAAYFVFVLSPATLWSDWSTWRDALLVGRFASPTSAGVLFAMLAAAGLASTWVFRKARVLAIFDDIDTILFMIPLKMMMIGMRWQLAFIAFVMIGLLWVGWRNLHRFAVPLSWPWVMSYSAAIVAICEAIYLASKLIDEVAPIHLEVLLPAFILGCVIARPAGENVHAHDAQPGHEVGPETEQEQRIATYVSAAFMILVGLSMPPITTLMSAAGDSWPGWGAIALHVVAITIFANIGKMYPAFCYREEASVRERLAVAIAMWPRGEVGAGVLVVSLSYGVSGLPVLVATLSLVLNLLMTGIIIAAVKKLIEPTQA